MNAAAVSAITASVDFGTVVVGLGVVFAAVALVLVSMKGGKLLLSAIR